MSAILVQNELLRKLQAMPGRWQIGYPNEAAPNTPRLIVQYGPSNTQREGMSNITEVTADLAIRAEVDQGSGTVDLNAQLQKIVDYFPAKLRFNGVVIDDAPTIGSSFEDGPIMNVPITVTGRGYF